MADIADLVATEPERFSECKKVPDVARAEKACAPAKYVEFLKTVGAGVVSPGLNVYSGLVAPSDVYEAARASKLPGLWLIADDGQGYCYAFDESWSVVEIDPNTGHFETVNDSFEEFLSEYLEETS